MRKAIFPGTFDPFTIGHYSVVERALTFMDEIVMELVSTKTRIPISPSRKEKK